MKLKYTYILFIGLLIWVAISSNSGGMGNTSSDCASCHVGSTAGTTTIDSLVFIDSATGIRTNSSYTPNKVYYISLYGKNTNSLSGFGFQVNNRGKGMFTSNPTGTMVADSIWGHNTTIAGTSGTYTKSAKWVAPAAGAGSVTFKSILCAVNSNGDTAGDASSVVVSKTLTETILVAGASITSSATGSVCAGKRITFVCKPTNGGSAPAYDWKVNGVSVGEVTDTFRTSTLNNNDVVTCVMTSNLSGVVGSPVSSNNLTISITPNYIDSVRITSTKDSVCAGDSLKYTATPSAGASNPKYQWYLNGNPVAGKTASTYTQLGFNNADQISCRMTVANICPLVDTAISNIKTVVVKASPMLSGAFDQTLCNGQYTAMTVFAKSPANATLTWTNSKTSINLAASGTKDTIMPFIAKNLGSAVDTALITVKLVSGGCSNYPAIMKIIVNPSPKTMAPKNLTLCNKFAQPMINLTSTVPGSTIVWSNSNTAIGLDPSGTGNIPAFTATNTTTDSIFSTITATSIFNSCTGTDTTFKITVYPTPVLTKIDSIIVCNGVVVDTVKFRSTIPATTYSWISTNFANTGILEKGTTAYVPKFTAKNTVNTSPISSLVTISPFYKQCKGADSAYRVTVMPNKALTTVISSNALSDMCYNDTVKFKSTTVAYNPIYQWNVNGTPIAGENKDSLIRSTWAPLDTITLTVSTTNTCVAVPSVTSNKLSYKIYTSVVPTLAMFSKDTICSGTSLTFTTKDTLKGLSPVYKWTKNSTVVGTSTNTLTRTDIANGDTITCMLTSSFKCATPRTVTAQKIITVIPTVTPTVSITKDVNKICSGDSVTFTPAVTNGGTNPTYSWTFNSVKVDSTLTPRRFKISNTSDAAMFSMTSSLVCANPKTVSLKATLPSIGLLNTITTTPAISDSFCYNDSSLVAINTGGLSGLAYNWSTGQTTRSFYSKTTQTYYVTVTESVNNCTAVFGPITTHRHPLQIKPTLSLMNDRLYASYAARYKWFRNGNEMVGETTNSIPVSSSFDKFFVVGYNFGNCSDTSAVFDMGMGSISSKNNDGTINIYPIPAKDGQFTIAFDNNNKSKNIEIFDTKGEKVYSTETSETKVKIHLMSAKGVYLLKVNTDDREYSHKIILE